MAKSSFDFGKHLSKKCKKINCYHEKKTVELGNITNWLLLLNISAAHIEFSFFLWYNRNWSIIPKVR